MLPGHTVENIQKRMKHLENISNESLGKVGMGQGQNLDYNALMERLGRADPAPAPTARAGTARVVGGNLRRPRAYTS